MASGAQGINILEQQIKEEVFKDAMCIIDIRNPNVTHYFALKKKKRLGSKTRRTTICARGYHSSHIQSTVE